MQTYSHLIITAVLRHPITKKVSLSTKLPTVSLKAFLLGSVLPDIPLILISIWAIASDLFTGVFTQFDFSTQNPGEPIAPELLALSRTMTLYEVWFFENPWVITAQNLFHGPLLVALFIGIAYFFWRRGNEKSGWFFWLFCTAMLHTILDILLHTTDGPLVFFPFNWTWRFHSPVSYWDPEHYGREWSVFEHFLDIAAIGYLIFLSRPTILAWGQQLRDSRKEST